MVVSGLPSNAVAAARFSKYPYGDIDLTECVARLYGAAERVHRGDLQEAEALLTAQAVTLNTMFTHLAILSAESKYVDHFNRCLRLAFKAQAQCRATLETLAEIKTPRTVFAQQANVAHGPQQVNNAARPPGQGDRPARAATRTIRSKRTTGGS